MLDKTICLKCYVDVAFSVHLGFKLHTGSTFRMVKGGIISMSLKQKLNTKRSTEVELVGANDASSLTLWTKLFLEAQVYKVKQKIFYQDHKVLSYYIKTVKRVRVKVQDI